MKLWKAKVQTVYGTLENLKGYNENYKIAKRCGYRSCIKLWNDNPMIQGSTNPEDFGIVKTNKK